MSAETPDLVPAEHGKGPARGYSWPPFQPGNELGLRHGARSPRKVGERAELVRADLLQTRVDLADDPESFLPVELYCRAVAREELAHEGLEHAGKHNLPISPRLLEAATAAARAANELGTGLGIGPRASAELRQIKAQTAVTMSVLVREAPAVLEALRQTLTALGLDERTEEFSSVFADRLALVAGDDDDEE